MLTSFSKYPLIAMAAIACAAHAQTPAGKPGFVTFGAQQSVRAGDGDCWRTTYPSQDGTMQECAAESATYWAEVLFSFERAELEAQGRELLDDLAQKLLAIDPERVALIAHADRIGAAAYNEGLSARRADTIRTYLVDKGVPEKLMRFESRGAQEPVTAGRCDAMGPENRQNVGLIACLRPDRRVEIEVIGRQKYAR